MHNRNKLGTVKKRGHTAQTQPQVRLNKVLGQQVRYLEAGVDALQPDVVGTKDVKEPVKVDTVSPTDVSQCHTPLLERDLDDRLVAPHKRSSATKRAEMATAEKSSGHPLTRMAKHERSRTKPKEHPPRPEQRSASTKLPEG